MKFLICSLTACLFIFAANTALCQVKKDTVSLETIIAKNGATATGYPEEKAYLHFDKPYYAVGDTIWFKAYLASDLNFPSILSKVVYVELTGTRDSVLQVLKLPVENGMAPGNFVLSAGLIHEGNYHIKAYTRWMMNFEPDYFFTKTIPVGNGSANGSANIKFLEANGAATARIEYKDNTGVPLAVKKVTWEIDGKKPVKGIGTTDAGGIFTLPVPEIQPAEQGTLHLATALDPGTKILMKNTFPLRPAGKVIDLQFFPEGGDLGNGLPSKVAFKAMGADGFGANVKGVILDDEGKQVISFSSQHAGMGVFVLVPEAGKSYTAVLTAPAGNSMKYNLPVVKTVGATMQVTSALPDKLSIRFFFSNEYFDLNKGRSLSVVARAGQTICYAAKLLLAQKMYLVTIPKEKFPAGIVQLTIFEDNGTPLCERLAFVQRPDNLSLSVKADKPVYAKKQKVRLTIGAKSGLTPVMANLSAAVIDETKVPFDENAETTILTSLLLTGDLKGYIEKPNYYFNHPNEQTAADLDILMLTQGYRRFLYKNSIAGKNPDIFFAPEQGIEITGTLRTSTGIPVNKGNVKLTVPDRSFTVYGVTNGYGIFKFPNVDASDSSLAVINSIDYRYKNPMITIDQPAIKSAATHFNYQDEPLNKDSVMNNYLQNDRRIQQLSHVLKEVSLTTKAPVKLPSHLDYPALAGLSMISDHILTKDQIGDCASLLDCMKSTMPGVTFDNQDFYVTRDYLTGNRTPMKVFYNGMPLDANALIGINAAEIESVEIFLKDELGLISHTYNTNGVLVVNGKKVEKPKKMSLAEIQDLLPKSGEVKFTPQGYSRVREFYLPKYDTPQRAEQSTDLRTTVLWNPKVITDKLTGLSTLEYYTTDGRGAFRVTVEGMDASGHIGRVVYRYKVE